MTLKEWFDKYFAPEYLNVQKPADYRAEAEAELQTVLNTPAPATPAPAAGIAP